jgi:hypothetical protein
VEAAGVEPALVPLILLCVSRFQFCHFFQVIYFTKHIFGHYSVTNYALSDGTIQGLYITDYLFKIEV